jgi:hypothetical protein
MSDNKVPLAFILRKKGDEAFYTYDLGDRFEHKLIVEEVLEESAANPRRVEILAGSGACPPEDSNGLGSCKGNYGDFIRKYKANPASCAQSIREIENTALNYTQDWLTGRCLRFEPLNYDIERHRRLLNAMLAGPSVKKPDSVFLNEFKEVLNECALCKERLKPLMTCARCMSIRYCSRECQSQHWGVHKKSCKKVSH